MNTLRFLASRTSAMNRSAVRELLKLAVRPDMISFAGGLPAPELFPMDAVEAAAAEVLERRGREAMQYGETEGVGDLRDWLAADQSVSGWRLARENILVTQGAQQALDLIGKVSIDEGDGVLLENPTYLAALSAWRPYGARFEAIPAPGEDPNGIRWRAALRARPKLVYLVPNFGNPDGATLTSNRREALAAAMERLPESPTAWIEDDPYGELRYEGTPEPTLFELAARRIGEGTPILKVGTFSKTLVPGLRIGWVAGHAELIDVLVRAKQAADLHSSPFNQLLILELLRKGVLETQRARLTEVYRTRRDTMLSAMEESFPSETRWNRPEGGMFLWVTLPESVDASVLLGNAIQRGVTFVPGAEFHFDGSGKNSLRLNFTNTSPDRIREGIRRLGQAIAESLDSG